MDGKLLLKWICGISLSLFGLRLITTDLSGIFYVFAGLVCLPPILAVIENKVIRRFRSREKYLILIALLVTGVCFRTKTDNPNIEPKPTKSISMISDKLNKEQISEKAKKKCTLDYHIIYELNGKRRDGICYFVLINKINLSNDDFKDEIKLAIDEIVKKKGSKIDIDFLNDRKTLDLFYKSHYGSGQLDRILTKNEMANVGLSLVATFYGEKDLMQYYNTLDFFGCSPKDNPKVGKYVGEFEYNPN